MAKTTRKKALGRGLSALLNDPENDIQSVDDKNADKVVGNIVELELDSIEVNPFQPRTSFNEDALDELASSIRELGVIQPITVRKVGQQAYQLVSGERRFRASKLVGLETIPAYIRDLDPIEIALSYQRLIDEIDLTQEQLSDRVGKNRSTIANYLRLLKLDPIVQTGMRDGFLSMGHGRALINIINTEQQLEVYEKILKEKLSVRETEKLVKSINEGRKKPISQPKLDQDKQQQLKAISQHFGAKIDIKITKKGNGKIILPFSSDEDFNRIAKLLQDSKNA